MSVQVSSSDRPSTLAEQRDLLRVRIAAAKTAGLTLAIIAVEVTLFEASKKALAILDEALAAPAADLSAQHVAIVESLDADAPPPKAPLAPLRKPTVPLGAAPVVKTPPAPKLPPPRVPRKPPGPDAFDAEIPF